MQLARTNFSSIPCPSGMSRHNPPFIVLFKMWFASLVPTISRYTCIVLSTPSLRLTQGTASGGAQPVRGVSRAGTCVVQSMSRKPLVVCLINSCQIDFSICKADSSLVYPQPHNYQSEIFSPKREKKRERKKKCIELKIRN
jgi:hypothetical protein